MFYTAFMLNLYVLDQQTSKEFMFLKDKHQRLMGNIKLSKMKCNGFKHEV